MRSARSQSLGIGSEPYPPLLLWALTRVCDRLPFRTPAEPLGLCFFQFCTPFPYAWTTVFCLTDCIKIHTRYIKLLTSCLISILYHTIANMLCIYTQACDRRPSRPPAKTLALLIVYHIIRCSMILSMMLYDIYICYGMKSYDMALSMMPHDTAVYNAI